jgi:phage terminase large subunit-like protein
VNRAEKVIKFAERYIVIPDGKLVGQPIKLLPFQKKFIEDIYLNPHLTRRAILSLGRKNGKTALIAVIILAHLVGPEAKKNSQIVSGAMSREQAAIVFDLMCKMINLSPELSKIIKIIPSSKRLIGLPMNVEYKALAADGKTAVGLSPILSVIDEAGQVVGANSDFISAIETGSGAHENPLTIYISTQAANDADYLSLLIDDAIKGESSRVVCHVYEADAECDLMDEEQWLKANPALGVFRSINDVREQAAAALRMPSQENSFRNLILNQRVSRIASFVSVGVWKANASEPSMMQEFDCVTAGLDLSMTTDLTAFVVVGRKGNKYHVFPFFWLPKTGLSDRARMDKSPYDVWARQGFLRTCEGKVINYEQVVRDIAEVMSDLPIETIAFDRWGMAAFKRDCERLGIELPLSEWGQGFKDMTPALAKLESALISENVLHGNHPVMNMCAVNAVVKVDPAGGRKLDKSKATGRIDGMQALAMAMGVMDSTDAPVTSVYETRGVLLFD